MCSCGADLVKLKRNQKVKYWISYRLPGGKQKREPVRGKELSPYSIEDARKMHSKRVVQKAENRILDILPEAKMTFNELSEWYLSLSSIKALTTYDRVTTLISNFNKEFGDYIVSTIKPIDLENYQDLRLRQGRAPATVDMEIGNAKSLINKGYQY